MSYTVCLLAATVGARDPVPTATPARDKAIILPQYTLMPASQSSQNNHGYFYTMYAFAFIRA